MHGGGARLSGLEASFKDGGGARLSGLEASFKGLSNLGSINSIKPRSNIVMDSKVQEIGSKFGFDDIEGPRFGDDIEEPSLSSSPFKAELSSFKIDLLSRMRNLEQEANKTPARREERFVETPESY